MLGVQTRGIPRVSCQMTTVSVLQVWAGGVEVLVLASALPAAKHVPGSVVCLSVFRNLPKVMKALLPYLLQELKGEVKRGISTLSWTDLNLPTYRMGRSIATLFQSNR